MQEKPRFHCICYGQGEWFSEQIRRPYHRIQKEKALTDKTPDSPRSVPDNNLTYTCSCFDCKTTVITPDFVVYCPNENCRSKWVRTEYICGDCGRKDMIYDAIYKLWFFDNVSKSSSK